MQVDEPNPCRYVRCSVVICTLGSLFAGLFDSAKAATVARHEGLRGRLTVGSSPTPPRINSEQSTVMLANLRVVLYPVAGPFLVAALFMIFGEF